MIKILVFLYIFLSLGFHVYAFDYRHSSELSPNDYLLKSNSEKNDPIFDEYRTIELDVDLGVGTDCGRIDFKNTLKASLKNIFDWKYFGDMGKSIIGASPMLVTCYFSPTWCAILKHSRIRANLHGKMRLDQCALIDKYTDSRTEDYYRERQANCRKSINSSDGNMESAMEKCKTNRVWQADISNWAGSKYGEKSGTNKLIDDSAKWAGFTSPSARQSVDLVKALVGDSVISRGRVSVEFGPQNVSISPRTHFMAIEKTTYKNLCGKILTKAIKEHGKKSFDRIISDEDLKVLSGSSSNNLIDRQTIRSLIYMSYKQRKIACEKLASSLAMTIFSIEMNKALDVLTTATLNPNLPDNRKREIENKRRSLKDSLELNIELHKQKNEPLNQVLSQINANGKRLESISTDKTLKNDSDRINSERIRREFMDCSDGVMCEGGI